MHRPTVPLTLSQKARLVAVCLPFVSLSAGVVFYYAFWVDFASRLTGQPIDPTSGKGQLFMALMAVVLIFTGRDALRGLRDLSSGVALVTEDRMVRIWRSRRYWRASFEQLGKLRLARAGGNPGQPNRIVYSPATKIAWEVVPVADS